jgi:hypothetical protein
MSERGDDGALHLLWAWLRERRRRGLSDPDLGDAESVRQLAAEALAHAGEVEPEPA